MKKRWVVTSSKFSTLQLSSTEEQNNKHKLHSRAKLHFSVVRYFRLKIKNDIA